MLSCSAFTQKNNGKLPKIGYFDYIKVATQVAEHPQITSYPTYTIAVEITLF